MRQGAYSDRNFASPGHEWRFGTPLPQTLFCAIALSISSLAGFWILYAGPNAALHADATPASMEIPAEALPSVTLPLASFATLRHPAHPADPAPMTFAQLMLLRSSAGIGPQPGQLALGSPPVLTAGPRNAPIQTASLPAEETRPAQPMGGPPRETGPAVTESLPLPAPRPATLLQARANLNQAVSAKPPGALPSPQPDPSDHQAFFDKVFGIARPAAPGPALAYAAPDDGGLRNPVRGAFARPPAADQWTAVYDIAAHTVYLPDGTRLEAHSGLGARLDDPRGVAEHMRGATPPNTYALELRSQLFHGVRALRLNPVGNGTTYGRAGLLAHTYMLGPRGDSNGCVVFKNYKAFLEAYDAGAIKRLAVVDHLN